MGYLRKWLSMVQIGRWHTRGRFEWSWPVFLAVTGLSCNAEGEKRAEEGQQTEPFPKRVFAVTGQVVSAHPEQKEIQIRHEAIAGYMGAMTMPFEVMNRN